MSVPNKLCVCVSELHPMYFWGPHNFYRWLLHVVIMEPDPAGDFLPEEPEDDDMGIHFVNIKKYYTLWKNRVSQQCGNIQILALSKSEES